VNERHVLVVGSGGSGLAAALAASDAGARVTLVEAAEIIGGTYAYSMGIVWCPANHAMAALGLDDSVAEAMLHVSELSGGKHDDTMLRRYLTTLPDVLEELSRRHDVPYQVVARYPDYYAERAGGKAEGRIVVTPVFDTAELPPEWRERLSPSPMHLTQPTTVAEIQEWGGFGSVDTWDHALIAERHAKDVRGFGAATIGYLLRAVLRVGVEIHTGTALLELLTRDKVVAGARVVHDGEEREISCDAVILASGGFDWDDRLHRQLDPYPVPPAVGAPTVDGSAMLAALDVGAAFAVVGGQILIPTYAIPGDTYRGKPRRRFLVREPSLPGSMIVDRSGERFCDESFYRAIVHEMTHFDVVSGSYPHLEAFFVFDEQWKASYPMGPVAAGEVPEWLANADSPAALAKKLGIDADQLAATIAEFNRSASIGEDPKFHRGRMLQGRNHGRLFAVPIAASTVGASSGLCFDTDARVLSWRNKPIHGLFCAGNIAAGTVEGLWYNSGIANGRGLAFGSIAGKAAARRHD
jgi:3-oxosteroid 1-dehydrogenase